ncbi:MAG TPA: PDZ domain-containing protein [Vicinamibacterales bacterium]|nr:PDZ domain-containing protein [Vicinamibacterales bacterium]
MSRNVILLALTVWASSIATAQKPSVDAAFDAFWAAPSPDEAAKKIDAIVHSGVGFEDAYRLLKQGRTYGPQPTGVVRLTNQSADGVEHNYALNIPETYDSTRRYQVRFHLHGGIGGRATNAPVGPGTVGALEGAEQIYVVPYAWADSPWWSDDQALNLAAIVDALKRRYNIDENRVVVSGVSDGGTGAYYIAMRETTPFASFLPLNGYLLVLAARDIDDGLSFANNLRNKPIFAVNGGRDPLYPTRIVDPTIEQMKRGGVTIDYHPQPNGAHNTAWWPEVKDTFEAFAHDHPRPPLPDTLTWEVGNSVAHHRAHWLVIDKIAAPRAGAHRGEAQTLDDLNDMPVPPSADFGARSNGTRINRVMPRSNADHIGLKPGDVLVRLNDQTVPSAMDVGDALEDTPPGSKIDLLVARDNLPVELSGIYQPQIAQGPPKHLFARAGTSGRVDLSRAGNLVTAATRDVAEFTLLISPDQFDFGQPIKVVANGRPVFNARVERKLATLLKYAAADNDRTMLFGAEIHVKLD